MTVSQPWSSSQLKKEYELVEVEQKRWIFKTLVNAWVRRNVFALSLDKFSHRSLVWLDEWYHLKRGTVAIRNKLLIAKSRFMASSSRVHNDAWTVARKIQESHLIREKVPRERYSLFWIEINSVSQPIFILSRLSMKMTLYYELIIRIKNNWKLKSAWFWFSWDQNAPAVSQIDNIASYHLVI